MGDGALNTAMSAKLPAATETRSCAFLVETQVDKIVGFISIPPPVGDFFLILKKNEKSPVWYPAESLGCPDALHKFLIQLNELPHFFPFASKKTDLQETAMHTIAPKEEIVLFDVHGNGLGTAAGISSDVNISIIAATNALTLDRAIDQGSLSLILSSISKKPAEHQLVKINSKRLRRMLIYAQKTGILPASQHDNRLFVFSLAPNKDVASMIMLPRPSYYESLLSKNPVPMSKSFFAKVSVLPVGADLITWNAVEAQSLNTLFKLPTLLLEKTGFKFFIHAPSSLFEVQQFGRWLMLAHSAHFVKHLSSDPTSSPPNVEVVFIHHSCLNTLHQEQWISKLFRISYKIRFFAFGEPPLKTRLAVSERIPSEIFPLDGGGVTTFSLRLVISVSNEYRIREYIKRLPNFTSWSLLLPTGLFDALKAMIDILHQKNDHAEAKRLHHLRNDLFKAAYHETSKEAADNFSELEFIVGCSQRLIHVHRFFVLVDDPSSVLPAPIHEKYTNLLSLPSHASFKPSSLVSIGTFSDLMNQFN